MDPKTSQPDLSKPEIPAPPAELTQDPHAAPLNPTPSVTTQAPATPPTVIEPPAVTANPPSTPIAAPTTVAETQSVRSAPPPPPPVDVPQMHDSSGPSSKPSKLLLVLLVVFAIVLAGLVYTLLSGSLIKPPAEQDSLSPVPAATDMTTPVVSPTLSDEEELDVIDVGSVEAELEEVKTDLEGL